MMRSCFALLVFLAFVCSSAQAAIPPPRRQLAEVQAALAKAPPAPSARRLRPLNVLLIANRKDHGAHEHDYPRWMARWKVLLGGKPAGAPPSTLYGLTSDLPREPRPGAARVTVETAVDWPTPEQLARADVAVAFMGTGGIWNEAKLRDLKALLDRGAGFVALHAAVIAEKPHARPLADLLGLAWEGGTTLFRHGALDLKITAGDHPITRGLPERIHFEDESYWPLVGDASRVQVLATADEAVRGGVAPQPMFWTRTVGKGRVFCSIPGHYSWTFDDPYFRMLTLRGIAWAAGESPYRFDPVVLAGARTTDRKPEVREAAAPPPSAPVAPEAGDENLILWLDAADRATLTTAPDGRVTAWRSKATRTTARLTSENAQQPALVAQGLGGRPAVRFDGVDDVLRDTAFRQTSGEWTVAVVVTPRSNAGEFRALLAANRPRQDDFQTGFNIDLGPGGTPAFSTLNLEGIKGGGATNLRTASAPFGAGHVLILSTGGGSSRLWVNGQEEEARGAGTAATVMEELRLGGRFYMGRERGYFHGDVSEVLLYRTRLPDAERAGLMAHLMKKYGPEVQPPAAVVLDPWDYLPAYEWSATRRPLTPLDEAVARSRGDARSRRALEARFVEVIADPANTRAARDFACRRLAIVGSAASVPALTQLLAEPALAPMACFALERIPGREAEKALLGALISAPVAQRTEAIWSLGARRSRSAVRALAPLASDTHPGVRRAAITALASIGGAEAVSALLTAAQLEKEAVSAALLRCAERFADEGRRADAAKLYERLRQEDVSPQARRAAVRAQILGGGPEAGALLVEQLAGRDLRTQAMALLLVPQVNAETARSVAASLERLTPDARARAIIALADRGDSAVAGAVRAAVTSDQPGVRIAAVRALGRLGDGADVPALLPAAAGEDRDLAAAAAAALAALPSPAADAALITVLNEGPVHFRPAAAAALGRRAHHTSVAALLRAARGDNPALRAAAIPALGEVATLGEIQFLVEMVRSPKAPADLAAAEKAIAAAYTRIEEKERLADLLLTGFKAAGTADADVKTSLMRLVSLHGGPKALDAIRGAVAEQDEQVRAEALDLLVAWETPDAAPHLLAVANASTDPVQRTLALRGYLRMASLPSVPAAQKLAMCREGLQAATRDDERRLALAALAGVPTVDALQTALPYLEREGLSEEAGAAVVAIAGRLLPEHRPAVLEAVDRITKHVTSAEVLRQAADLRARVQ